MKTLKVIIRLMINDVIKKQIELERKTLLYTQVNYGVEAYNYACSVLYVYASNDINNYVSFDYDAVDGFTFRVNFGDAYESIKVSSITVFTPESPYDNEAIITLYDESEFNTVEYYVNQL